MKEFFISPALLTSRGGFFAFADLALALLPITFISELQVSVRQKIGLSIVLGLGIL